MATNRLITEQVRNTLANYPLYSQDGKKKDTVCNLVFHIGNIFWYITEGQTEGNDFTFFGIVTGLAETEYGYFSAAEMESIEYDATQHGLGKLKITQIEDFTPRQLGTIADPRLQEFLSRLYDKKTEKK